MFKQLIYFLILLRPKQWIKNSIIFIPLLFSGIYTEINIIKTIQIFIVFSLLSGCIYIFNDYKDREKDRNHPIKKNRPLASNKISANLAISLAIIILGISIYFGRKIGGLTSVLLFIAYIFNNLIYTLYLKEIEIIDVFSIAIGFVIRGLIGTFIIGVTVSPRLLIMLFFGALRLGFLKRYQEVKTGKDTRGNIEKYNSHFLEQIISMLTTIIIIGYSLYSFNSVQSENIIFTVPFVVFGIIRYYYNIFFLKKYEEAIENIVLHDRRIILDIVCYLGITLFILMK